MTSPFGGTDHDAPPPGYVPYQVAAAPRMQSAVTLRRVLLVSGVFVVLTEAVHAGAYFLRSRRITNALSGHPAGMTLQSILDVDHIATLAALVAAVAGSISLFRWSGRVADNAVALGAGHVNPQMARWGWFIPIGTFWIGFKWLRTIASARQATLKGITLWQVLSIARVSIGYYAFVALRHLPTSRVPLRDALLTQSFRHGAVAVLAAGILIAQVGVTKRLNDATGAD